MLRQFRPAGGGPLCEQWLATTQTSSVMEYRRRFIQTAAPFDRLPEDIMLGQFLNGLKEDIRVKVRLLNPISLEQAMELALRMEEKHRATGLKKSGMSWFKGDQYSSVSFKSPRSSGSTSYGLHSSPKSVRSWHLKHVNHKVQ